MAYDTCTENQVRHYHHEHLNQYYNSLASVDQHYRELQYAQGEWLWHESKSLEANALMEQYGLSSSLDESNLVGSSVTELNREWLLSVLKTLEKTLKKLQDFEKNLQSRLSKIAKNYEDALRQLGNQQTQLEKERSALLSKIIENIKKLFVALFFGFIAVCIIYYPIVFIAFLLGKSVDFWILTSLNEIPIVVGYAYFLVRDFKKYKKKTEEERFFRASLYDQSDKLEKVRLSQEEQLRIDLENLRQEPYKYLETIQAAAIYAHYDATEVKVQNLKAAWQQQKGVLNQIFDTLGTNSRPILAWNHSHWQEKSPIAISELPGSLFRIGDLLIEREQHEASVSAILALRAHHKDSKQNYSGHVALFSNDSDSRSAVLRSLESLAVRTIASMPASLCKAIFIDPVNAGNTFPFKNFPSGIVGKQTYTRSEDIREQLRVLAQHVEQVIQRYLNRSYEMIEDYNNDSTSIIEAYRYVFIADFPSGFDHSAVEDLKSLLLNGARAGVYVVIHVDDTLGKPRDFRYDVFNDQCTVLRPAYGLTSGGSFCRAGGLKVGYVYLGRVTRITRFGAFVEFLPGKEGKLPTSQITEERIQHPEEAVSVGQILPVKVTNIDTQDHTTLSCLDVQPDEARAVRCLALQAEDFQYGGVPLFTIQLPGGEAFRVRLDMPPGSECFNRLASEMGEAIQNMPTDVVPFERLYPEQLWASSSSRNLCAPIGMAGAKDKLEFLLGMYADGSYEPAHALLAGATGSGKSYTLHSIIFSLALHYSPDELELYLLDYKEGVEFQIYVTPDRLDSPDALNDPDPAKILPHARVISIESDAEFGLSVLEQAIAEIETRGKLFKSVGVAGLEAYRKSTGKILPRILIVIDEYQQMYLQANTKLCGQLNNALETITKQGRSFGVHILLGSQSPNVKDFNNSIYQQMAVRMAMNMSRSTASTIMAEGNTNVVELLDRAGKLAYNDRLGEKNCNQIGQVAFIDSTARRTAMQSILQVSRDRDFHRATPTYVFNGIQAAQLKHNSKLNALAQCDFWLPLKELNKQYLHEKDWIPLEHPCATWLGESMRIGRQVCAIFRRRPRNHFLMIGRAESEIFGILGAMLTGLVHTCSPDDIAFKIADLALSEEDVADLMPTFKDYFANYFEVTLGKRFPDSDRQIVRADEIWQQVEEEFDRRQEIRKSDSDATDFGKSVFFVLALGNLSQMDRFRPVAGNRNEELSRDAKKLLEIAEKGSELGIHMLLWLNDFKAFHQLFGGKTALTHFDLRVAFKMNGVDSKDFIGENHAENLRDFQAYFKDASNPDYPDKFRSYKILSAERIASYAHTLEQRK
jgi:DNA segregation ATPase FtsK/SpoIIIE, S-DNA-T family